MTSSASVTDFATGPVAAGGLWRIEGDRVLPVDRTYGGPLTVLVPAEALLILVLDLPFRTRKEREAAAPFAAEGLIAEPLDQVHIALGAEVGVQKHVCAVVRHDVMRHWLALLSDAGLERCILTPDALAAPAPAHGQWRLAVEGDRALVRTGDGGGFAIEAEALPMAWEASGRPGVILTSGAAPEAMRDGVEATTLSLDGHAPVLVAPPVDLRQGLYAPPKPQGSPWRPLVMILAAGAVAHLLILVADTLTLHGMAERREAEIRRLVAERAPGSEAEPDLVAVVDRLAPEAAGDGAWGSAMGGAAQALAGQGLAFRSIAYAPADGLDLAVTAPDAAALQAVGARVGTERVALDPLARDAGASGVNARITLPAGDAR